jgi:hypothetical protein
MKQLIVLSAVFILLVVILMQIPLEMINYERRHAVMFYVNNAKERAKQNGCYTDEILNELLENIAQNAMRNKISESEIIIDTKTTSEDAPKYRLNKFDEGEIIYLKISVPFKNIIAASNFLGIKNNKGYYVIEITTTSERLENKE